MTTEFEVRRFAWGLSQGLVALAVAGSFWFLYGFFNGLTRGSRGPLAIAGALAAAAAGAGSIATGARTVRRRAHFDPSLLRTSGYREDARRMMRRFAVTGGAQWIACATIGLVCSQVQRRDLIWPLIGVVVGLHFIPLGRLFKVPAYVVLGSMMATLSAVALIFPDPVRSVLVGFGDCVLLWAAAWYLIATTSRRLARASHRVVT
jgi:hypothetical protein